MQLSQKPECIDLMLHDDLKDDYSFRTNIQDIASLLSGILNIMQQANLTDKELAELEQLYNERLNGGNKKTKISKITDYLLKDDVIVVMDVDGVLAPYEFSELSHSMTDDEWDKLVASGESPYKDVRPIKLMQKFIQKKGIDKVYTCSKSPSSEIPGKRAFIKNNYNLPDDNIYFTLEKTEKLTVLQTLQQKLGLKPSQIAIVEDTVKTLDYIRAHSDFVTVHVSSFME